MMKLCHVKKLVAAFTTSVLFMAGATAASAAVVESVSDQSIVSSGLSALPKTPRGFISGDSQIIPDIVSGTPDGDGYEYPRDIYVQTGYSNMTFSAKKLGTYTDECGEDHFINAEITMENNDSVGVGLRNGGFTFDLTGWAKSPSLAHFHVHLFAQDGTTLPSQLYTGFSDFDEGETVILGKGITHTFMRSDADIKHDGSVFVGTTNNTDVDQESDSYQKHYLGVTVSPDFDFQYGNKDYTDQAHGGMTLAPLILHDSDYYPLKSSEPLHIRYDANGGQGHEDDDLLKHERDSQGSYYYHLGDEHSDMYHLLKTPTKTKLSRPGYRFNGWAIKPDGSCPTHYQIFPHRSMTVYAQWQKVSTISFDANGGEGTFPAYTGDSGSEFNLLKVRNVFSKEGYYFTEYLGSDGKKYQEGYTIKLPDYNLTLQPVWIKGHPSITYDENWNDGVARYSESDDYEYGQTIQLKKADPRPGYRFIGWNSQRDGSGKMYTSEYTFTDIFGEMLFAQWQKVYQVTLDMNDNDKPLVSYHDPGTVINPNTLSGLVQRKGYQFIGWNTKKDGTGENVPQLKLQQNTVLFAQWRKSITWTDLTPAHPTSHTVSFDSKGGSPVDPVRADYGQKVTLPVPSRPGFQFMGWFTTPDGKGERLSELTLTTDTTVYASWKKAIPMTDLTPAHKTERNILFRSNDPQDVVITVHSVDGDSISTQVGLTRQGYRLVGWADHEGSAVVTVPADSRLMVDGDRTLYAVWEQNTALDKPSSQKPVTPSHPRVVSEASSPVGKLASTGSGVEPLLIAAGVLIALALLDLAWLKWGARRARAKNGGMRGENGDYL